jgi:hypothetical protein
MVLEQREQRALIMLGQPNMGKPCDLCFLLAVVDEGKRGGAQFVAKNIRRITSAIQTPGEINFTTSVTTIA